MNSVHKFATVIDLSAIHPEIFTHKKSKQRYLDFAFKLGLKSALKNLIASGELTSDYDESLFLIMDEHTTATDGVYELREAIEQEFKLGTFNWDYNKFFPPLLPNLNCVQLTMADSRGKPLIRAADIIANRVFYCVRSSKLSAIEDKVSILHLP